MKSSTIIILIFIILIGISFLYIEKNNRDLGAELANLQSEYILQKERQSYIENLKSKRGEYFKKIFFLNMPFCISDSVSKFLDIIPANIGKSPLISEISIRIGSGIFNFTIGGKLISSLPYNRIKSFNKFVSILESFEDSFVMFKKISGKNNESFTIEGEISTE